MKVTSVLFFILFFLLQFASCKSRMEKSAEGKPLTNRDTAAFISPEPPKKSYEPVDLSPMDMSYYPVDYPILKMTGSIHTSPVMRLIYSRPHLQGRILFKDLLKYGQPWRMGANEATEIQVYRDVFIKDKSIPAGRYILYCIPEEKKWTIVLNNNIDTWGLKMDSSQDVHRFEIPVARLQSRLEYLTMVFEKTKKGADLVITWDDIMVKLPFEFPL